MPNGLEIRALGALHPFGCPEEGSRRSTPMGEPPGQPKASIA